jgi:hypothetical protein
MLSLTWSNLIEQRCFRVSVFQWASPARGVDVFAKRLLRLLQTRGHDPCMQLQ